MNSCCNRPFSCQFWLGNITQIIKNWKHWLRVQNLPVGQSFERATKVCVLGYMASSCAALSNFAIIKCSKTYFLGPPKMNIIKMPPHPSIIPALFLFLDAYYYYSGIMFAGLSPKFPTIQCVFLCGWVLCIYGAYPIYPIWCIMNNWTVYTLKKALSTLHSGQQKCLVLVIIFFT